MGILFGLFIVFILVVALLNRRKQRQSWVAEERREEGGEWIDKRAGERGAFGARDAEMEQERQAISRQGRVNELARLIRTYMFEHYPGFDELSDAHIKTFTATARAHAVRLFVAIDAMKAGQLPEAPEAPDVENEFNPGLKKHIMNFAYDQFPWLFDQDLDVIKQFDCLAGDIAEVLLQQVEGWKKG